MQSIFVNSSILAFAYVYIHNITLVRCDNEERALNLLKSLDAIRQEQQFAHTHTHCDDKHIHTHTHTGDDKHAHTHTHTGDNTSTHTDKKKIRLLKPQPPKSAFNKMANTNKKPLDLKKPPNLLKIAPKSNKNTNLLKKFPINGGGKSAKIISKNNSKNFQSKNTHSKTPMKNKKNKRILRSKKTKKSKVMS